MARVQGSQECGYWLQVRRLSPKCSADHLTLQDKTLRWLIPVKNEPYLKTVKVYVFLLLRIILYYKAEVCKHDVPIGYFGIFLDVLGSCLVCFVHSVIWVGNTFYVRNQSCGNKHRMLYSGDRYLRAIYKHLIFFLKYCSSSSLKIWRHISCGYTIVLLACFTK